MNQMQNRVPGITATLPAQRASSVHWLLLLILLIAFFRGTYHLGHNSLWWDESLSHYRATQAIPAILSNQIILEDGINQAITIDNHPPLYFLILHFTVLLLGDSEFALRFPSLIFAALCTALLYVWGRRMFGPLAGLLSALMGACSPLYLWYAQEARPYTSVTFWGLLTMVALGRALDLGYRRGARWWLTYIFSTGAMLYTHYLSFLLLPVHGVVIVLFAARSGQWKQIILTSALVLLVALPVLAYGLYAMPKQPMAGYRFIPLSDLVRDLLDSMGPGPTAASRLPQWLLWTERFIFLSCVLALCIHVSQYRLTVGEGQTLPKLLTYLTLPVIIMYLFSHFMPAYMNVRHLIFISPAFYIILGAGLATTLSLHRHSMWRGTAMLALALLLLGMGWGSERYFRDKKFEKDDHRAWGAYLRRHAQTGDCIVINPAQISQLYFYYADSGLPWVGLPLLNAPSEQTEAVLRELTTECERIWLASSHTPHWGDPDRIPLHWLQRYLPEVDWASFHTYASIVEIRAFSTHQPFSPYAPTPQYPLNIEFDGKVKLLGYDLPGYPPTAGQPLRYVLYWQVLSGNPTDYHFTLEVLNAGSLRWGTTTQPLVLDSVAQWANQNSSSLAQPPHKTSEKRDTTYAQQGHQVFIPLMFKNWPAHRPWSPDQYVRTEGELAIEPGTPPGEYRLALTMYNPAGLLPHGDSKSLLLTTLEIRRPPTLPAVNDLPLERRIDRRFAEIELVGSSLRNTTILPGEWIFANTFWRAAQQPQDNYRFTLQLIGPDGTLWNEKEITPAHSYPMTQWQKSEVVQGKYGIRVPPDAPAGRYRLELVQSAPAPGTWARVWRRDRATLGSVVVAERERVFTVPQMQHQVNAKLGEVINLLGYDLSPASFHPGDTLTLTLYWQCQELTPVNYTVFVHVIDQDGKVPVQRDVWPREWTYPTELWVPGEVVEDVYRLPLPADATPGEYTIAVGMFNADTGERLPVTLPDGQQVPENWIILNKIEVKEKN